VAKRLGNGGNWSNQESNFTFAQSVWRENHFFLIPLTLPAAALLKVGCWLFLLLVVVIAAAVVLLPGRALLFHTNTSSVGAVETNHMMQGTSQVEVRLLPSPKRTRESSTKHFPSSLFILPVPEGRRSRRG